MTTIMISQNTHIKNKSNISLQKTNGTLLLHPPPPQRPPPQDRHTKPEEGKSAMNNALVGVIVLVGEEGSPLLREGCGVHSEPVILRRDEATPCPFMHARLVVSAISVPANGMRRFRDT